MGDRNKNKWWLNQDISKKGNENFNDTIYTFSFSFPEAVENL